MTFMFRKFHNFSSNAVAGAQKMGDKVGENSAARSAAGFSPTLSHLFGNFCESFDPGSCKVRSPGQVKLTIPYKNFTIAPQLQCLRESYESFGI